MLHRTLLGLGLALALISAPARAAEELKVGDKAPAFSLKGSDGKTYSLADFKGKKAVIIAWYPKAFTGGCTIECKNFGSADAAELKSMNVAYFTASVDSVDLNTKFAESVKADYPILSDPDKATANAYGVINPARGMANRWTFYIDKDGVIREIDKKVKTATSAQDAAATLKKLGIAGK